MVKYRSLLLKFPEMYILGLNVIHNKKKCNKKWKGEWQLWLMFFLVVVVPELLQGDFQVQMLSPRSKADYQELLPNISALVLTALGVHSWEDLDAVPRK
jgi:hypothetical protein